MHTQADKKPLNQSQSGINTVSKKQTNSGAGFQIISNRPEAIAQRKQQEIVNSSPQVEQAAQMQAMASKYTESRQQSFQMKDGVNVNNGAKGTDMMGEMPFQFVNNTFESDTMDNSSFSGKASPIQRQVAIAKNKMTNDFIELTSIDYAVKRAGGPIALFKDSDFSAMGGGDILYIVAHGRVGQSGDVSPGAMIKRLTDKDVGLKNPIKAIIFTSCSSGKGTDETDNDSVINLIKAGLKDSFPGITIIGARGPSAKSDQTGDEFTVVDSNKKVEVPHLGASVAWRVVQNLLKLYWEPAEDTIKAIAQLVMPDIEAGADAAAKASGVFFMAWKHAMRNPSDSPTLESIKSGFFERYGMLGDLSKLLKLHKTISQEELLELIQRIEKLGPLTLDNPMAKVST